MTERKNDREWVDRWLSAIKARRILMLCSQCKEEVGRETLRLTKLVDNAVLSQYQFCSWKCMTAFGAVMHLDGRTPARGA